MGRVESSCWTVSDVHYNYIFYVKDIMFYVKDIMFYVKDIMVAHKNIQDVNQYV